MLENQELLNSFKIIDYFIESLENEYKSYDLKRLKIANSSILNMFMGLVENLENFQDSENILKIQQMSQKLILITSKISIQYEIKDKKRLFNLPKKELENNLKNKLNKMEQSFIELLGMCPSNIEINDESSNNLIKVTFESYIKEYDEIKLSLENYKVNIPIINFSKEQKENLEYKCKNTAIWLKEHQKIFEKTILEKILAKLLNIYKYCKKL